MTKTYESLCSLDGMTEREWLDWRRRGIGGSDASVCLGLNKWRSRVDLWLDKTGKREPDDLSLKEAVHWGRVLESVVADEFSARTGLKLSKAPCMYRSVSQPFMLANVDRLIDGENAGLECKTTSAFCASEWADNCVPDSYIIQCQHYMAVMGWDRCYIAVLIGGQRFVHNVIPRDESLISAVVEGERDFWENHVLTDVPPEPETQHDVSELYGCECSRELLEPTPEDIELVSRYKRLKLALDDTKAEMDSIKTRLTARIATKLGIHGVCEYLPCRGSVDWKKLAVSGLSAERIEELRPSCTREGSRRLRIRL